MIEVLDARKQQVYEKGKEGGEISCEKASLAGSVSQRACVFCGSRVVLYPIADAVHLVHGPVGCAAYTWDIRGSLSSGPELHRLSFSTDLQEKEVIYGGEKKLYASLTELIAAYHPKAAFVYATCIVGLIGDDVQAVCTKVQTEQGIPVIPVHSEGFKGTKKDGYRAACEALYRLIGKDNETTVSGRAINILGDFNVAGETWIIKEYYRQMGIEVIAGITGDGRVDEIGRAHRAGLNVVRVLRLHDLSCEDDGGEPRDSLSEGLLLRHRRYGGSPLHCRPPFRRPGGPAKGRRAGEDRGDARLPRSGEVPAHSRWKDGPPSTWVGHLKPSRS